MCFNCPDVIEMCFNDECKMSDYRGDGRGTRPMFCYDDEYCKHLKEKYGHDRARWEDRYGEDDEE